MLAEEHFSVSVDVENAPTTGDQFGFDIVIVFDGGRQTGGPWQVVSLRAVGDRDLHSLTPRIQGLKLCELVGLCEMLGGVRLDGKVELARPPRRAKLIRIEET